MKSGYEIVWSEHALEELKQTIEYLENNFSERELKKLSKEIERSIGLVSINPFAFPQTENLNVRKLVVAKYNSLYYKIENEEITVVSFFSNRQSPINRKIN